MTKTEKSLTDNAPAHAGAHPTLTVVPPTTLSPRYGWRIGSALVMTALIWTGIAVGVLSWQGTSVESEEIDINASPGELLWKQMQEGTGEK